MLCSESGTLITKGQKVAIEITPSDHPFLTSAQNALNHRDWLLGMVGRFKEQKEVLREVSAGYKDEVPWVKPDGE